ncbi:MAG TPA: cell envelope integrity protein CreD [Chitinophagaceae bacterium]|nr:cell envelope integrity protein CreD [Chitinophagaceae bacterium]
MENKESSIASTKGKPFVKALIIFGMALGLWLPTQLIMETVRERAGRQQAAINEVSNKWAGKQTVTGPILMLPYHIFSKNDKGVIVSEKAVGYFLPDQSTFTASISPEKRYRGIFQVIVYRSEIIINGKFKPLQWRQLKTAPENFIWNEAALLFKVEDNLRGINEDLFINWDDTQFVFDPLPAGISGLQDAFIAPISLSQQEAEKEHSFNMKFSLHGSQQLLFAAAARESKLDMKSTWPDPGFTGVKLPDTREVKETGFTASWKYLNRSVPMVWNNNFYDLSSSHLGTELLIPVDSYDKTERSVKYALLCIMLTFAAFFLIETIYKKSLHLVHYGLAGLALVLFYTLLLSISEYTGFNIAYLIAAVATIGLVAWFVGTVMRSSRLAIFISFVLAVVYSYIFIIIQLQDYALLMGSVGLFISLAIIMYFSRKLQW